MAIKVDSAEIGSGGYRIGGTLAEINIIPLVDVTLVLLLIFMLTAPLMYRGIECAHWRTPYDGDRLAQLFLHYVDQNGAYADWKFDRRSSLSGLEGLTADRQ